MKKKITTEEFIEKARKVHGNKYDYSKAEYKGCKLKICIICPEHGEFWQTPDGHLQGRGCPVCRYISVSNKLGLTTEEFIKKAKEVHGNKYDYSKVEYKSQKTKVCIICPEHGEFWQDPTGHIDKKAGCPKCSKNYKYTTEEFIRIIPNYMKEKYNFSKFKYIRTHDKSIVICPEHGEFLMSPHNILKGIGCPGCSESKLERNVRLFLKENKIKYIPEYKPDIDFHKQAIDFYLPDYNIAIECQGIQHFQPTDFAGKGEEWAKNEYKHIVELDINKQNLCREKKIKLLYFTTELNKKLINFENNKHYLSYNIFTELELLKNLFVE